MKWVAMSDGTIPDGALKFGYEADGTPLYVARAYYAGGLHLGKVRPGFEGALIPYAGTEVVVKFYEVLCI
ncbi:DM9 repeat-containing protein [Anaeromicrobium sediminis]|uniref:Uncharacterized protein n=1 Tax=Anaeromicrobium sediminis TaxID=1478221 RepID=A0A267MJ58_9FIRM|nr:DM9 repeat-containing protein [Anaeromicrobium sediminis]PAB59452.1 hypothetical protein CCE28_09555 [Anaeromicrobium sediminis]